MPLHRYECHGAGKNGDSNISPEMRFRFEGSFRVLVGVVGIGGNVIGESEERWTADTGAAGFLSVSKEGAMFEGSIAVGTVVGSFVGVI
jgi:hypothetical protein